MRKNGFTLIELLAVIVILAIIALIATPIILGIINDAREKSNERSVELYASAVRNGIAAYQLREGKEVLPGTYNKDNKLPFEPDYEGKVECTNIIISEDGKVSLEKCTVNGGTKEYSYGTKQGSSIEVGTISICNPLNVQIEGTYTAGDKYECDVDPNKEGYDYIFYVLNSTTTEVNLIMDSNINISGEAVKEGASDLGYVAWVSKADYTRADIGGIESDYTGDGNGNKGPITAIEYIQSSTLEWTNVNPQTINVFSDHEGSTHEMAKTYTTNARMPYINEVTAVGCDYADVEKCPLWMVNYLDGSPDYSNRTEVSGVSGYWILCINSGYFGVAGIVGYDGNLGFDFVSTYTGRGVRPVINLLK